ncbi:cytochrome c oxidase subunit 4 [Actinomadura scrupuli]|uniref:cytochrome c oxidase subunit 4 n=1 Tax=Actinomadura scrupuli TaxID=559629 RepID=UPI003D96FFCE
MRFQAYMFYGCALFFLVTDIAYWLLSHDWTGTTALALSVCLAGLVAFYVHFTVRRLEKAGGGPLPEDNKEGDIADGAGELGFFSPHSWWPLFVGASAAMVALGMVFGWWLVTLGVACTILSSIGLVFEYYRGQFSD